MGGGVAAPTAPQAGCSLHPPLQKLRQYHGCPGHLALQTLPPPEPPIRGHSLGCGASGPRWGHLQARDWTSALSPRTLDLSRVPARAGWGRPLLPCPAARRCVTVTEDASPQVLAAFPRLSCVVGAGAHGRAGGPRSAQPLAPAPAPARMSNTHLHVTGFIPREPGPRAQNTVCGIGWQERVARTGLSWPLPPSQPPWHPGGTVPAWQCP